MKKFLTIIAIIIFSMSFGICLAGSLTLGWTPNSESNLAGYKIYYDIDSGDPYLGTTSTMDGMSQGDSPIIYWLKGKRPPGNTTDYELEDNSDPEVTIHVIDTNKQWFLVVTAFDTGDYESDYSNEVNTVDDAPPPDPNTPPSKIYNIRALNTIVVEDVNNASGYSNEPPLPEVIQNIRVVKQ